MRMVIHDYADRVSDERVAAIGGETRHKPNASSTPPLMRTAILLAPAMMAMAFVLTNFADSGIVLNTLPRPLAVVTAVTVGVQALLTLLARSSFAGVALTSMAIVLIIDGRLGLVLLAIAIVALMYRRRSDNWPSLAPLPVFAGLLLVMATVRAVSSPAWDLSDVLRFPSAGAQTSSGTSDSRPSIYVVLLDGYPRSDILSRFGYDNSWFERELHDRGFDIAPHSYAQYTQTALVLPSLFHMQHIASLPFLSDLPRDPQIQKRAIKEALADTPVHDHLDELGYWTTTLGYTETYVTLNASDEVIHHRRLNGFERQLIYRSTLRWVIPGSFYASEHQALVRDTFQGIESIAERPPSKPVFLFAHVLSPHTPLVFGPNGELVVPSCLPDCDISQIHYERLDMSAEDFGAAYGDQTHFINTQTLDAVDAILHADPAAVVVIFSDHGTRTELNDQSEWFKTFMAARTPDHPDLLASDGRSIAIFPRIFNAYFGMDIAIPRRNVRFLTPDGTWPLTIEPWP